MKAPQELNTKFQGKFKIYSSPSSLNHEYFVKGLASYNNFYSQQWTDRLHSCLYSFLFNPYPVHAISKVQLMQVKHIHRDKITWVHMHTLLKFWKDVLSLKYIYVLKISPLLFFLIKSFISINYNNMSVLFRASKFLYTLYIYRISAVKFHVIILLYDTGLQSIK